MWKDIGGEWLKLTWQKTDLIDALATGNERVNEAIYAALEQQAPGVEAHMKQNASWTDQTGNARQGLRAEAYDQDGSMGIILYHQVPYGIYLETKFSGRYAIILPTIEIMGPQVMANLEMVIERTRF